MSKYTATPHPEMDDCVVVDLLEDSETIVRKDWAESKDWIDIEGAEA
jgi:hypothetical protein